MEITSVHNPLLQKIRKSIRTGRQTSEGYLVAEGPHLVEEAARSPWRIVQILTTPAGRGKHEELIQAIDAEVVETSARAFEAVTEMQHSQEILALLEPKTWTWQDLTGAQALVLALDGIQDPGNAGTIIRSAEAFGATGVILLKGSARVSNGKLLRASAGSAFRVPLLEDVAAADLVSRTEHSGMSLYALDAAGGISLAAADFRSPCVLIAGNEGSGVSAELRASATAISIPTKRVESINAAVACSVALFVASQQRESS